MIELKNVSYAYHRQPPTLHNVSTVFADGKITSILGPNGCGKSTLLKVICRLLQPSDGKILLHGRDITTMKGKEFAKQAALLAQNNRSPEITVADLVAYGRYPHQKYGQSLTKKDKAFIQQSLDQVKMSDYADHMIHRLSGGQRQRAHIAMALAQDTEIIFLDEPTTYLDINIRFEIMELIRSLNQAGKTIIMVLHDLNLALDYSDHIVLMNHGTIQMEGTPQAIIESGMLDRIFNIETHVFQENGKQYYHFAKENNS